MKLGLAILVLAGIVNAIAWIWLIVVTFRNGETMWGSLLIASFILPIGPFVALVLFLLKWEIVRKPALVFLTSTAFMILGGVVVATQARGSLEQLAAAGNLSVDTDQAGAPAVPQSPVAPDPEPAPAGTSTTPQPTASPRRGRASRQVGPRTPMMARPESATPPNGIPSPQASNRIGSQTATESTWTANPLVAPVHVDFLRLGEPNPNRIRRVQVRIRNPSPLAVKELRLGLDYLDMHGQRLGHWMTIATPNDDHLASRHSTNEFDLQAFFVPQFTESVGLNVEGVLFANGSRWPKDP